MNTPLQIAMDIGRVVCEAQSAHFPINASGCADDIFRRFPNTGFSRTEILEALRDEARAAGVPVH